MRVAQRVEEELKKRREVEKWSSRMYSLLAVQRVLERMSGTTAAAGEGPE